MYPPSDVRFTATLQGETDPLNNGSYPIYSGIIVDLILRGGGMVFTREDKLQLGDGVTSFDQYYENNISGNVNLFADTNYDLTVFIRAYSAASQTVPIPGAVWLFGSGLAGLAGLKMWKPASKK